MKPRARTIWPPEVVEKVIGLRVLGWTLARIGAELGRTAAAVAGALAKYVPRDDRRRLARFVTRRVGPRRVWSAETVEQVRELHGQGRTARSIAAELAIPTATVFSWLQPHHPRRPDGHDHRRREPQSMEAC